MKAMMPRAMVIATPKALYPQNLPKIRIRTKLKYSICYIYSAGKDMFKMSHSVASKSLTIHSECSSFSSSMICHLLKFSKKKTNKL